MVEELVLKINEPEAFDEAVHNALPDDGRPVFITKANATREGRAAVVISFMVEVDGQVHRAQTVLGVRHFAVAAGAILSAHLDDVS